MLKPLQPKGKIPTSPPVNERKREELTVHWGTLSLAGVKAPYQTPDATVF